MQRLLSWGIYALSGAIGVLAYVAPFLLAGSADSAEPLTQAAAPVFSTVLLMLCLIALLVEIQGQVVSTKIVAVLGVLIATTATLRWIEVAIPGPAGFSPIFAPIILVGYVFGARVGFLMGALTLFASALVSGGVGPWLPYQMFTSGWIGMGAGWLPRTRLSPRAALGALIAYGIAVGFLYGFLTNLYFWPFLAPGSANGWLAQDGVRANAARYGAFYLATSALWDLARSLGNGLLLAVLGVPALRALTRFRDRFHFELEAAP